MRHWRQPSLRDLAATLLVLAIILVVGTGARQMVAPFVIAHQPDISLSPAALPLYTLRTVTRMLAAMVASLLFTFTHATLAAAERTLAGDFPRIALGIAMMSLLVIAMNRPLWRPLYRFAERRTRLD
jgi:hypothetical protein